jgi:hypothetical protein
MYQKTMMIMEMEKDWALFFSNCALCDAEVGGDLLFAAQITDELNISHSSASKGSGTIHTAHPNRGWLDKLELGQGSQDTRVF